MPYMDLCELNHPASEVEQDQPPGSGTLTHGIIGHLSSDEELQQAVCASLLHVPGLDASLIQVALLGHGEVMLVGRVPTSHQRALALRVARDCAKGRTVHADLSVGAPHAPAR